jgi:hypothetical protein
MNSIRHTPKDFASIIYGSLVKNSNIRPLALETIESIVDALFWTSLQREEAESHLFSVIVADSKKVDVDPPELIRYDRWQFIPFSQWIQLNPDNLTKLAAAASSESALIVVYAPSNKQPVILGLIDQQLAYYRSARHERYGATYTLPPALVLKIFATGHLVASFNGEPIAELRTGQLLHDLPDVFTNGPIYRALRPGFQLLLQEIFADLSKAKGHRTFCREELRDLWTSTFKRLLCEIREIKHGGTILVSSRETPVPKSYKIKYVIDFKRLHLAVVKQIVHRYEENLFGDMIHGKYIEKDKEIIPVDLYLNETIARNDSEDASASIDGSIKFVCTLSKHDGAVLMSPDFSVSGFGVEITTNKAPPQVVSIKKSNAGIQKAKPMDTEKFGTRHRSAMRFCWANPGAVAFVISQEGGVRAMTRLNKRVVVWEDIKLLGED